MLKYMITGSSVTVIVSGKSKSVDKTHPNFVKIIEAIKANDESEVNRLIDIADTLNKMNLGNLNVIDGKKVVHNSGEVLPLHLEQRILEYIDLGLDALPLSNFFDNLMQNPSYRAVNELYDFLEVAKMPITEDGCFVAYKKVREDYLDIYSGTMSNAVGKVCEMPRFKVDEDSDRTCSTGLHVCSFEYLQHFGSSQGDRVVLCKINPRDVVAIPKDYNNTKMRVCRYEVVDEFNMTEGEKLEICGIQNYNTNSYTPKPSFDDGIMPKSKVSNLTASEIEDGKELENDIDCDSELNDQLVEKLTNMGVARGAIELAERDSRYMAKLVMRFKHDGWLIATTTI